MGMAYMGFLVESPENSDVLSLRIADMIDQEFPPDPFLCVQMSWKRVQAGTQIVVRFPAGALTDDEWTHLGDFVVASHEAARPLDSNELLDAVTGQIKGGQA